MTNIGSPEKQSDTAAKLVSRGLALLKGGQAQDLLLLIASFGFAEQADPRILAQKAYAHAMLGRVADALAAAELAMQSSMSELWALDMLGNVFTHCHRPDKAYAAFSRARQVAPDRPDVLFNFATAASFLGLTDEAERAYDGIIAASPGHAEAFHNRSLLRRQTHDRNHVSQLASALRGVDALPWQSEVHLRYALGKELEDLGDHDAAFASLARGAAVRRRHMRYAVGEDVDAMARIAAKHDGAWCASAAEAQQRDGPVFILGLPRSGSTLLERMLGRHSQVQPLGELQTFGQVLVNASRANLGRVPASKAELIDLSADLDLAAMGDHYLAGVASLRDARPRFTDKLPLNFLYAGLIARALPGATLLHIRREPIDLCFAIYKTLFRDAYPYSYDLAELGAYHRAYQELMDHWREALGGRLVEIEYEALVTAPRDTFEALLPRLDLDFEEACLSPQEDRTAVMTASAAQVRQPIQANSVGSAARYEKHLGALREALDGSQLRPDVRA
jgi:tetratricopeptide (TPR) repeat protein